MGGRKRKTSAWAPVSYCRCSSLIGKVGISAFCSVYVVFDIVDTRLSGGHPRNWKDNWYALAAEEKRETRQDTGEEKHIR